MNPSAPRAARRGFTLVELLVVIGIIIILVAIVGAGVRHTRTLAARHQTEIQLKLCEDMLAEYKAVNGYKNILGTIDQAIPLSIRLPDAWISGQYATPMFVYPRDNGRTEVTNFVYNPVSTLTFINFKGSQYDQGGEAQAGNMREAVDPNDPRWVSDAVRWTQGVMFILLKDPKNRALIEKLPPTQILEKMHDPVTKTGVVNGKSKPYTIDAAVPLDGWQCPIIFVPPGGLHIWSDPSGVGGDNRREFIVRTSGTYDTDRSIVPPVGPNDHPFFASAGPDGYFTHIAHGDDFALDNIYSFQQ